MVAIKICGVKSPAAFDAVVEAGADFIGFNFFPPSPRYLTPMDAGILSRRATGGPGRVGLFVDPDDATIAAALAILPLDILQLHADATRAAAVREKFGLPVWLAVGVTGRESLPGLAEGVDRLLLDAQAPADAKLPGGNAASFDWAVLHGWQAPVPWLLAGGLTPGNVAAAIRITAAPAVDVSSGVETARGVKDPDLIRRFIANARGAQMR